MIGASHSSARGSEVWTSGTHVNRRDGGAFAGFSLAVATMFMLLPGPVRALGPDGTVRIVAYGDSLTAGYQLAPSDAFPAQLEKALKAKGLKVEVINAGVSGDTTAAALARFDWAIPAGIDAAIVALGANDALRGLPPAEARRNLDTIVSRLKTMNAEIVIAGIPAPRNWGEGYVKEFDPIFAELAARHGAIHYPFFLDGMALKPQLSLPDGLHPNAQGVGVIVANILPAVEQLIARVKARVPPKT